MKLYIVWVVVLWMAVPSFAYQVGQANRTNFGAGPQQPQAQKYRSFSNYNSRTWGRGNSTSDAQTSDESVPEVREQIIAAEEAPAEPAAKPTSTAPQKISKKQVQAAPAAEQPAPSNPAAGAADSASTQPAANAASAQAGAVPAEAAAMMQQMQGLMSAMGSMTQPQGQNSATKPGAANQPTGMPDMSALMGGMMPAQPQTMPTKK